MRGVAISCLFGAFVLTGHSAASQPSQGDATVKKLIAQLLEDKDVKKRRLALFDLEIEGKRAPGVLQAMTIALEKDPEAVVRRDVALVLGRMGEDGKEAIPSLAHALRTDKDDGVREAAARALLQMVPHSKRALQPLVDALKDSHAPTRAAVALTIKTLGEQSKTATPELIAYLASPLDKKVDAGARMFIALALGRVGPEGAKATSVLIIVLSDAMEDVAVREAAAESLGRLGLDARGAAKPLADVLQSTKNEQSLRIEAAKALAKVEGAVKEVWPALKVGIADNEATVRVLSVRAAGPHGKDEPEIIKALVKLARSDDNVEVRLAAVQELGLVGGPAKSAEADLKYIMEHDERDTVRQEARTALERIQGK